MNVNIFITFSRVVEQHNPNSPSTSNLNARLGSVSLLTV